jgi:cell division protein FtsB
VPEAPSARQPASRPHFTGRAAILAIVLCGIALSLAYPVREYISQRKQIDQLLAQRDAIISHRERLQAEHKLLHSPAYIERQARDRLHMCLPTQMCYEIIGGAKHKKISVTKQVAVSPWYGRLWSSVRDADAQPKDAQPKDAQPKDAHHRNAQPRHRG